KTYRIRTRCPSHPKIIAKKATNLSKSGPISFKKACKPFILTEKQKDNCFLFSDPKPDALTATHGHLRPEAANHHAGLYGRADCARNHACALRQRRACRHAW